MNIDLHVHGAPWENSWAGYRRAVWYGWKAGLDIIGICEHGPRFNHRVPFRSLHLSELDKYFDILEEIRLEFAGEIEVLFGIELDYNENMAGYYQDLLPRFPLDYIVGSLHTVRDWVIDLPGSFEESSLAGLDALSLYEVYFEELKNAAKTGLFDFIAHSDFIKKAIPHLKMDYPVNLTGIYKEAAKMLSACDTGIEINTRGRILSDVGEFYPADEFLALCCQASVPLTIGSDAHDPKMTGSEVEQAALHAKKRGCTELSIWRKRKRYTINI